MTSSNIEGPKVPDSSSKVYVDIDLDVDPSADVEASSNVTAIISKDSTTSATELTLLSQGKEIGKIPLPNAPAPEAPVSVELSKGSATKTVYIDGVAIVLSLNVLSGAGEVQSKGSIDPKNLFFNTPGAGDDPPPPPASTSEWWENTMADAYIAFNESGALLSASTVDLTDQGRKLREAVVEHAFAGAEDTIRAGEMRAQKMREAAVTTLTCTLVGGVTGIGGAMYASRQQGEGSKQAMSSLSQSVSGMVSGMGQPIADIQTYHYERDAAIAEAAAAKENKFGSLKGDAKGDLLQSAHSLHDQASGLFDGGTQLSSRATDATRM